jgi:hypothetical protein
VVSVDTKKQEVLGEYAVGGASGTGRGSRCGCVPTRFPDKDAAKAVPYGIYDLAADAGWVAVGCDGDTAAFAVATLRRWWQGRATPAIRTPPGCWSPPTQGGANGYRVRAWKRELAGFAHAAGLQVTVCQVPPGTSKTNTIEHRLFSRISTNWRGRPLTSHEVVVGTIGATTTRTGLSVHAELDPAPTRSASPSPTRSRRGCRCLLTTGTPPGTTPCGPSHPSRRPAALPGPHPTRRPSPDWLHHPTSPVWGRPPSPVCWQASSSTC